MVPHPLRRRLRAGVTPFVAAALASILALPTAAAPQVNAFGVPSSPEPDSGPAQPAPSGPAFGQPAEPPGNQPQPAYPPPQQPRPQQPPAQQPPPRQPQAQAPQSPAQYLVGTWHGQTVEDSGRYDIYVSFRPDGTFVQQQSSIDGQGRVQIIGHFDVSLGPNGGTIEFKPQRWEPRQVCSNGNCQPFNPPPSMSIAFQPLGRDSLRTPFGSFQRIGPPR